MPILLLPECYADTALIQLLAPATAEIEHISGVHNVVKTMRGAAQTHPEYTLVGIVDKDVTYKPERRPMYFDDFTFEEIGHKITFGRKINSLQYLIMLDKAIETFLLWNAEEIGLDVITLGFSTVPKQFGKQIKREMIAADPNYRQLLTDLHALNAPGIITLQTLLHDLFPA